MQRDLRLPALCSFRYALSDHLLNAIELNSRHNRADINGLIEWRADPQSAHAIANLRDQRFGDALLHEKTRAGAAYLPLIEPDAIDQPFDGAIQIRIFKDDEGRFSAKF